MTMSLRTPLLAGLLAGAAALAAAPAVAAEKTYDLANFDAIDVGGAVKLEVTFGKTQRVVVEEPDGEFGDIKLEVDDGVLDVDTRGHGDGWFKRGNHRKYTLRITMKSLSSLDVSGAVNGAITGVPGGDLDLDVSGAVKLTITGACGRLNADLSGASKLMAADLKCQDVALDLSGANTTEVHATKSISLDASGASKIIVHGAPASVSQDTSGSSKITFVGS